MTRDEFMKHAEQEIEQAFRGQRNRMMNLVEQAWAEGKRNAEVEVFTAAGNELLNVIKKELFPKNDRETRFCPNCGAKMDLEDEQ